CGPRPPAQGDKPARVVATRAEAVRGVRAVVAVPSGVAVVADTTWAAMAGRDALEVEWERGPNRGFSSAEHMRRLERAADEAGVVTRREGKMPAEGGSARVLRARYHYPFAAHAPIEPMSCVAHVTDGRCEVWAPTQGPNDLQAEVARLLGLAPAAVRVNVTFMGGGFGRRLGVDFAREAAEVSRRVRAPVQVTWTRSDDMRDGHFQAASIHDLWGFV